MNTSCFVDTSVILRFILGEARSYPNLHQFKAIYASELLRVEALRVIDRIRIHHHLPDQEVSERIGLLRATCAAINEIPIQRPILRRSSEPFPIVVGTLDAIHLATAQLAAEQLGNPFLFLTHDTKQAQAAISIGFDVEGIELF